MNNFINFVNTKQNKANLPLEPIKSDNDFINFVNTPKSDQIGTTQTTPQKTQNRLTNLNNLNRTIFQKGTSAMGKTLGTILAAVNVAPTIFGAKFEKQVQALTEMKEEDAKTLVKELNLPSRAERTPSKAEIVAKYFLEAIKKQETGDPWYVVKKLGRSLKGDMSEIGTEKAVKGFAKEFITGKELTTGQNVGATAVSIALDLILDPLTYLSFGGTSAVKIGEQGLTKAGTKVYAGLIKQGVAKGLTREIATEAAEKAMVKMLKEGGEGVATKLFSKGGIKAAEWIPKVGGESLIPYKDMAKVIDPIAKYTGLGKAYKGLKNWQLTKIINKAVSPTAGVPEELYKLGRKAESFRQYENIKEVQKYIKPLKDLGNFSKVEAEDIYNAIRKIDVYQSSPDKVKKAADIIAERFTDIRQGLVNRGVDIGHLDRYAPQLYADVYGKEFTENIKNFAGKLPGLEETVKTGALKRGKEFFEFPRLLFNTVEEAEAAGFKINKNIFDLLGTYEAGASRIHAFMDIVDKVKVVGVDLTQTKEIPEGFIKGSGILENYAFPKDVANYLGSFNKTFFNNTEIKGFLKYYDGALRWWKTMATVVSPGFHFRNFFSNIFNSWLGGNKNPLNYVDAAKVFKGTGEVTTQVGEKVAGSTVLEEAMKRRVLGKGWFGFGGELGGKKLADELAPTYQKVLKGVNLLGAESYLAKAGRKLGITVEEYSRLAHFIDVFKKTGNYDIAAEQTFKYLFDYSELTAFWKNVVNRGFPFGTWMRKNTALQFEQLLKQPAKYGAVVKAKKLIESLSEGKKPDETYLPEWLKEEMAMRTPFKDSQGNFIYMRLDLPYLGISDITDWRTVLGGLTPALKVPAELGFGKELFTGKDIERYKGYTAAVPGYIGLLPDWIKKKLGVVRAKNPKTGKIEERMNPYIAYLLRQNPLLSKIGKLTPFPEQTEYQVTSRPFSAMSILGGIGFTPYDVKYRKKVYEKEKKEQEEAYKKKMKEIKLWK